jgi:hypothetical protein
VQVLAAQDVRHANFHSFQTKLEEDATDQSQHALVHRNIQQMDIHAFNAHNTKLQLIEIHNVFLLTAQEIQSLELI